MDIVSFLKGVVDAGQAQVLIYLIAANLVLGIIVALTKGQFELNKLKDFWKRVLVVFGGYLTVSIASKTVADFAPARTAIWAALIAYMVAQIVGNLKDLGLPLPDKLTKYIER